MSPGAGLRAAAIPAGATTQGPTPLAGAVAGGAFRTSGPSGGGAPGVSGPAGGGSPGTSGSARDGAMRTILVADIGGTSIKLGFATGEGSREEVRRFPTADLRSGDPVERLAEMARAVSGDVGLRADAVVATVPGFLDADGDRVLRATNVPELDGRRLASELSARLGVPTFLERDSVLALMGEVLAGAGRGAERVLGVFFGTGVGAAYLEGGRPFRGAGWALELGHIPFRGEGRRLEGMRPDSLETYVSGRALQAIADRHRLPVESVFAAAAAAATAPAAATATATTTTTAAAAAEPGALDALAELEIFVRDQAYAIGTAVALLSPDAVVVGGGICDMAGFPRARLSALLEANAPFAETGRPMDLRWAALGWRSVLHGAPGVVRATR